MGRDEIDEPPGATICAIVRKDKASLQSNGQRALTSKASSTRRISHYDKLLLLFLVSERLSGRRFEWSTPLKGQTTASKNVEHTTFATTAEFIAPRSMPDDRALE